MVRLLITYLELAFFSWVHFFVQKNRKLCDCFNVFRNPKPKLYNPTDTSAAYKALLCQIWAKAKMNFGTWIY